VWPQSTMSFGWRMLTTTSRMISPAGNCRSAVGSRAPTARRSLPARAGREWQVYFDNPIAAFSVSSIVVASTGNLRDLLPRGFRGMSGEILNQNGVVQHDRQLRRSRNPSAQPSCQPAPSSSGWFNLGARRRRCGWLLMTPSGSAVQPQRTMRGTGRGAEWHEDRLHLEGGERG